MVQQKNDDEGISFEFRLLTDVDKPLVAFNDGNLSYLVTLVGDSEEGTLHAVAQFRSMTGLNEEEYRAAFPVVKPKLGSDIFTVVLYDELKKVTEEVEAEVASGKLKL